MRDGGGRSSRRGKGGPACGQTHAQFGRGRVIAVSIVQLQEHCLVTRAAYVPLVRAFQYLKFRPFFFFSFSLPYCFSLLAVQCMRS